MFSVVPQVSLMVGSSNLPPAMAAATTSTMAIMAGRKRVNLRDFSLSPGLIPMARALVGQAATHSPQSVQSTEVTLLPWDGTSMP